MTLPGDQPDPWSREAQGMPNYPQSPYPPPPSPPAQYPPAQYAPTPPPPRRRGTLLWVSLGVVIAVVLGGAIWGAVSESRTSGTPTAGPDTAPGGSRSTGSTGTSGGSGETKVVTATDKKSQVTVPAGWKDVPGSFRNELASLQLGDLRTQQYVLVVTASKGDFDDLAGFAEACLTDADALEEADIGPGQPLTIGGLPAVQHVLTGKASGLRIVFWYTMVEGKNSYFQVVGWTVPSNQSEAEPVILEVVNSFRELAGG